MVVQEWVPGRLPRPFEVVQELGLIVSCVR